jgi:hypothetical protein
MFQFQKLDIILVQFLVQPLKPFMGQWVIFANMINPIAKSIGLTQNQVL